MGSLILPAMPELDAALVDRMVGRALAEDLEGGDVTVRCTIADSWRAVAHLVARAPGVLAGLPLARRVFETLEPGIAFRPALADGDKMEAGQSIAEVEGTAGAILSGERTALNFLQHLSGIATRAAAVARLCEGTRTRILDTRKTIPGLRVLAKYACRLGGVTNHRLGLFDGVLIKNNHLKFLAPGEAVRQARRRAPATATIEIEVETLDQLQDALAAGPDIVMLDNMDLETMRQAMAIVAGRARVEVSGSVTPERVAQLSELGVDYISMGMLTHSVQAVDISLTVKEIRKP